ncbi:ferredoxin family protein [Acetobacter sp. DsW_063]|uniref:4Fe-4S dicluster domain-containing protein n=1 Tax=Acetobacter sp. DsW_063 TaxID=1514894 RepID=UPI000A36991A|nr:ferredoxin family protein [Acetobacter sp. DsW_063]OUJ12658.1 ferredoxin [Acetobacter sp. DsW_063]
MITSLDTERCTACNQCVATCPRDVFEKTEHIPTIARPQDCQTCFLCELYCTADALFVHPEAEPAMAARLAPSDITPLLGEYRRESGWDEWSENPRYANQHWRMEDVFRLARDG